MSLCLSLQNADSCTNTLTLDARGNKQQHFFFLERTSTCEGSESGGSRAAVDLDWAVRESRRSAISLSQQAKPL